MMKRSSDVINQEIALLGRWAEETGSHGRGARCLARRVRIQTGARTRMDALLADARGSSPADVAAPPHQGHEMIVSPNEHSAAERATWKIDALSDAMLSLALDHAEANSNDAVLDARTVFRDCTSGDPRALNFNQ